MNFNLLRVFDHGGAIHFDFSSRSIFIKTDWSWLGRGFPADDDLEIRCNRNPTDEEATPARAN